MCAASDEAHGILEAGQGTAVGDLDRQKHGDAEPDAEDVERRKKRVTQRRAYDLPEKKGSEPRGHPSAFTAARWRRRWRRLMAAGSLIFRPSLQWM